MRFMLAALTGAVLGLVCARVSAKGACLKFSQSTDGAARALLLRIDNDCSEDMTCSLSWRVSCVSTGGRQTTAHDESGLVIAGANRTWTASAAACAAGDGYQISAPTWSCKPVPTAVRNVARGP